MTTIVGYAPEFTAVEAISIAESLYGIKATAKELPSERDQNFRMDSPTGETFVLKFASAKEQQEVLELQNMGMTHLLSHSDAFSRKTMICPTVVNSMSGEQITSVTDSKGKSWFTRLLSWIPGIPLALVKPHSRHLMMDLGRFFGNLDKVLSTFRHPATHREFYWDLKHAQRVIEENRVHVKDDERKKLIDIFLDRYVKHVKPVLSELRTGVIHGDPNDYNIIVKSTDNWEYEINGAIDFGDIIHTHVINELAITCAYAMLNKTDPLSTAANIISGYHMVNPLSGNELSVLFDLICMRLCTSVCNSALQIKLEPENKYLTISQKPAWKLLHRLSEYRREFVRYLFRDAASLPPVPKSERIVQWLKENRNNFTHLFDNDSQVEAYPELDLSVGSRLFDAGPIETEPAVLTESLQRQLNKSGSNIGIGCYDEARLLYATDMFDAVTEEMPERRTIHLGIDFYMQSGAPVYAFMDAIVHGLANNSDHLDFGPTIILEHNTEPGEKFYTLYGHLSLDSLDTLTPGMKIEKGERFARIGSHDVNGGWPPHLHFQLIIDLLGREDNFPCVARPGRRNVWKSISPDPGCIFQNISACKKPHKYSPDQLMELREKNLGKNLSISYRKPIKIVRGIGQYLYDEKGLAYLDGVNNVCHVGHCHPRVVEAGRLQMGVLNTNTRYLHDNIVNYARRLLATFPEPLNVCYFVCSGSEANELALRLARTNTGQQDIIMVDGAYHGNTQALIDISPYKHNGPGGKGAPEWAHEVVMPCGYRGPHKGTGPNTGEKYAKYVKAAIEQIKNKEKAFAAYICESMLGCGGQVVLPDNYLKEAFKHVRDAGGVCIADEVQTGFGRAGTHFWAFETQGVVPDIVTLGKPMGNGHPLAAVVTTPEIADAFNNGMEYFNTYGGNPVSCAIGMAVLDVIENENLQKNARIVGEYLLERLKPLKKKYPLVGDVRGLGLYIGVELVTNRETLEPAGDHASHIVNRARQHGILLSTDGPFHNVIKLKPPIIFTKENADTVVDVLDKILRENCLQV